MLMFSPKMHIREQEVDLRSESLDKCFRWKAMTGMASPLWLHPPGCWKHRVKGREEENHRCHCGVTVRCGVLKPAEPQAAFPDGRVQITVESTKRTFFLLN